MSTKCRAFANLTAFIILCQLGCFFAGAQFVASGRTNALTIGVKPAIIAAETEVETQSGLGILRKGEAGAIRVTVTNRGGAPATAVLGGVQLPPGMNALQVTTPFALGDFEPGETRSEEVPVRALQTSGPVDVPVTIELQWPGGQKLKLDPLLVKVRNPSTINDHAGPTIDLLDQSAKASRGVKALGAARHASTSRGSYLLSGLVRDSSGVQSVAVGGAETQLRWTAGGMAFEKEVPLVEGDNTIEVAASDKFGNMTRVALRITRDNSLIEGRYFALLIAVQDYEDPAIPPLSKPIEDAERLAAVLKENYTFEPASVTILRNPDREGILREMMILRNTLTEKDNLLMFYAGHGNEDAQARMGYWLPSNAARTEKSKWLSNSDVRGEIRAMKVRHAFLITDACFSGALLKTRGTPQEFTAQKLYELPSRRGMTSGNETVPEPSVFLEQVIQQLKNNKDRYLLAQDLYARVRNSVVYNSPMKQIPNYGVIPEAGDQDGDFVFVRR